MARPQQVVLHPEWSNMRDGLLIECKMSLVYTKTIATKTVKIESPGEHWAAVARYLTGKYKCDVSVSMPVGHDPKICLFKYK